MDERMIEARTRAFTSMAMEQGAQSIAVIMTGNWGGVSSKMLLMEGNVYANIGAMTEVLDMLREQSREAARSDFDEDGDDSE